MVDEVCKRGVDKRRALKEQISNTWPRVCQARKEAKECVFNRGGRERAKERGKRKKNNEERWTMEEVLVSSKEGQVPDRLSRRKDISL